MYKYVIRCINGFQGIGYYSTHHEALAAAKSRTNYTGIPWFVDAVLVRKD